jgi:hypothetical protein
MTLSFTHNCPELIWQSQSQSYVMTSGQSASLSWCQAPIWGLCLDFYYCWTVAGLLMWGALSDERTSLPFTITAGPRQRSHSWVRVPRDSRPYFTVSDSRLPHSGGPGPRICIPQALGSLFVACYDSQGYGGGIRTRLHGEWSGRSRSLLPATSRHVHTCHRAPLGPMAIYLCNVKDFFPFRWSSSLIKEGLVFFYRLVFTYYTLLHLRLLPPPRRVLVEYKYI